MNESSRLFYLCNAIDEQTCAQRGITRNSTAATRKVFGVAKALRSVGVKPIVVSLGRGRQAGTGRYFPTCAKRVNGIPTVYAAFYDVPFFTHICTLLALVPIVFRLRKLGTNSVLLSYNRLVYYWLALELSKLLGFRGFIDLEDGDFGAHDKTIAGRSKTFLVRRYDAICHNGALLAMSKLRDMYHGTHTMCCYGVVFDDQIKVRDKNVKEYITIHLGGTLQRTLGTNLLAGAIQKLRNMDQPPKIKFIVTGFGEDEKLLLDLSSSLEAPQLNFLGKVPYQDYENVLNSTDVSLSLRISVGGIADNTFPSKVLELASAGCLVVSTRVGDVPDVFGDKGAVYLDDESVEGLANLFLDLAKNPSKIPMIATKGQEIVQSTFSPTKVGMQLRDFFYPNLVSERCEH